MTFQRGMLLSGAALLGFGCLAWVENCASRATCSGAGTEQWMPMVLAVAISTVGIFISVSAARSGYLLWRTSARLATLETIPPPNNLFAAMEAADIEDVRCLVDIHAQ